MKETKLDTELKIRLSPSIDDWTTLHFREAELDEINISQIKASGFDNLPPSDLKYLLFLHYRFAEFLTKKFSADLSIKTELYSITGAQIPYEKLMQMFDEPIVQTNIALGNLGNINLIFEWKLADMVINRLTGGKGQTENSNKFSDIEINILETLVKDTIPQLCNLWKNAFKPQNIHLNILTGHFSQDKRLTLKETFVFYTYNFYFGESGPVKMVIAYPTFMLRLLLTLKRKMDDPVKKRIYIKKHVLEKTKIPVKAILGQTSIKMKELKNIHVGDIISLDNKLTEPINFFIGDKIKFFAQPGINKNKVSLQLIFSEDTFIPRTNVLTKMPFAEVEAEEIMQQFDEEEPLKEAIIKEDQRAPLPVIESTKETVVTEQSEEVPTEEPIEENLALEENPEEQLDEHQEEEEEEETDELNVETEEPEEEEDEEEDVEENVEEVVEEETAEEINENNEGKENAADNNEEDDFSWDDIDKIDEETKTNG